jgi:cysteine synthase A
MIIYNDISELIGGTPIISLSRFSPDYNILAKCEFLNPLSLKDRPVLQIIDDAERAGLIQPGSTLIEATSGNTGMAVAYLAAVKGYKAILVMSEIQSIERRKILHAFGAELILTPATEGTAGARRKLQEVLAEHPEYFYIGQHSNLSNPKAHYQTTGPEIWRDTGGTIDLLVAALGTGGTICGAGRYLRDKKPSIKLIAIEPQESPFISKGIFNPHRMMGTAPGFVPQTLDRKLIDEILLVSEEQAFETCRQLAELEGILVGITSGAVAYASRQLAARTENTGKTIVCVLPDTGQRYLSVDGLFNSSVG